MGVSAIIATGKYCLHGNGLAIGEDPPYSRTAESAGVSLSLWHIARGTVCDVDVSGLAVVTLVDWRSGGAESDGWRTPGRLILIDERADPEQLRWLVDGFQGRLGGLLAELGPPRPRELGFCQVPMKLDESSGRVAVPSKLGVLISGTRQPYPALVPAAAGSTAGRWWEPQWSGRASACWANFPEHGLVAHLDGCIAVGARFRVEA